jgi:glucosamine--fructose-6-phosphate aminotransferase (isomerizing)
VLGVGSGQGENFLASDAMALAGVTDQIVYLEEGDVVDLQLGKHWIARRHGRFGRCERPVRTVQAHSGAAELGPYRHYMQKEIFEQPRAIADTLEGVEPASRPSCSATALPGLQGHRPVLILACGTSYYSGCTAKYWLEASPASRRRWRSPASTATATACPTRARWSSPSARAARRPTPGRAQARARLGMAHTLTICNVATSAMVRECELAYITRAGVEIGVASAPRPSPPSWPACSC